MKAPEFIRKMDWELLKKQKQDLIITIDYVDNDSELHDSLEGILHVVDAIQDFAVNTMGIDEDVVFDLTDEDDQ